MISFSASTIHYLFFIYFTMYSFRPLSYFCAKKRVMEFDIKGHLSHLVLARTPPSVISKGIPCRGQIKAALATRQKGFQNDILSRCQHCVATQSHYTPWKIALCQMQNHIFKLFATAKDFHLVNGKLSPICSFVISDIFWTNLC